MAQFGTMQLTTLGIALQNKAEAGIQLNFTRVAIGDGQLSQGQDVTALTALIDQKMSLSVTNIDTSNGLATLRTVFSNASLQNGFYVREFGIFAQDPQLGEILYSYSNAGDQADFLPDGGGPNVVEEIFDIVTTIASAANVTATIDHSLTFVTQLQETADILAAGWDYYGDSDPATISGIVVKPFFRWAKATAKILCIRNFNNTAWINFVDLQTGNLISSGSLSSNLEMNSHKITGLANGVNPQDAVTMNQVNFSINEPLGIIKEFYGADLPSGYLWCDGKTIGGASSGATGRANSDTINLFTALWGTANNGGQIKLYDLTGATVAKGTDAAADFAAYKRLSLPDRRGRTAIGLDSMGGVSANVIAVPSADILGDIGGEETHTLKENEMPVHTHSYATYSSIEDHGSSTNCAMAYPTSSTTGSAGGGSSHNNMQPWIACNYIMRY
jgi:microcystin-dependent protein